MIYYTGRNPITVAVSRNSTTNNTEKFSSGDVCEQPHSLGYAERGQSKRAIRSVQYVLGYAEHGNRIEEATPTPEHSCKMLF
jgi:hypothetical protein